MFAPDGMARAFFTSGGSDAVETALRLARQFHKVRGGTHTHQIPVFEERISRH
ncbi:hypothetical protein thalar_00373 [Litoreibacter arenae DSM 19593]|uniref:Uncharacterized protein n=1 Tax=Litoreibacter arenae DSM 19593 TaxID=1123360 RepID=S9RUT5_9RHOB|nr:hypothetical protein thalar_00373 [Litoreibacter arenae DSM 19593]